MVMLNILSPERGARYSIRAVSEVTGLTVQTLRAWERRYKLIEPQRDASGHRLYTAGDVSKLRRLRDAIKRGHRIKQISQLSTQELDGLLSIAEYSKPIDSIKKNLISQILKTAKNYQPNECDYAVASAFSLLPITEVIHEVLSPALCEVGERWRRAEFSIAQERMVTTSVRRHLISLLATLSAISDHPLVVFATVSGELHELGILMYAVLATRYQLRVSYLGADLPAEEIANYANRVTASAVAISMIMPVDVNGALQQLNILRTQLPKCTNLWIGGAAICVDSTEIPAGVVCITTPGDFEHRIKLLIKREI